MNKLSLWSLAGVLTITSPLALAQDKTEPKPDTKPTQPAESVSAPVVKLLDPGAEPRRELRYTPKAGDASTMTMRMKMSTKADVGGQPMDMSLPAMVMATDITVKEVRPNGDIAYDATFSKMDIEAGEDDNPMMVEGMKSALGSLKGMTAAVVISNRGETKQADFKLPPGANPMSKQMIDQLKQTINQLSAPLPAEAVGKGAKWEVATSLKNMGMTVSQTATMTLKDISGNNFTGDIAMKQEAGKQEMNMPGMPPGFKVELISLKSSGNGEINATTTSILPIESKMKITSDQEMKMTQGEEGEGQTMKQGLTIDMTLKSGPATPDAKPDTKPAPAGKS